jgi:hypothetical protein
MKQTCLISLLAVALLLCCCAAPVGATLLAVTVKGPVSTVMPTSNTLTINDPQELQECNSTANEETQCSWIPLATSRSITTALSGTIPDPAAFSVFKSGDLAVATSLGNPGERWVALAKLYGSRSNEEYVTDIVGDINSIPVPLMGDYSLTATTVPDCQLCSGTTCTASSSVVILKSSGKVVSQKTLAPGEFFWYNGRNDDSSVNVTFVKGEALQNLCPGTPSGIIGGTQPISDYIVTIVPPISSTQVNIRTATTTAPGETMPSAALTTGTTATTVPSTTPKSGMVPVVVIGAICIAGLLLAWRRK